MRATGVPKPRHASSGAENSRQKARKARHIVAENFLRHLETPLHGLTEMRGDKWPSAVRQLCEGRVFHTKKTGFTVAVRLSPPQ